jgi:hypothetical protein
MGRGPLLLMLLAMAVLPFPAAAACSGKLADLQSYAGKSGVIDDLLSAPAIATRLARLSAQTRQHLERNLDVSGPMQLTGCHLVASGNAPHMGTEQDAVLDVDLRSGTVVAAIHARGRIDIYVLADPGAHSPRWDALSRSLREWAVRADMGFPPQPPARLARPSSVRLHAPPPAPASAVSKPAASPARIEFGIEPDAAQTAAIRGAAAAELADCKHPDSECYTVALADFDDDGRADLLIHYRDMAFCGSSGCSGAIVMATPQGYASRSIGLPNFGWVAVLPATHHGMHDLQYNGNSPIWKWNGKEYAIDKADLPGANAPPWQTRHTAAGMVAMAVAIDSRIKTISVFCGQGKPLLAMLMKQRPSAGPVTLTFAFRGWTVNTPMSQANRDATLWMADLSDSDLPQWFAHRGNNPTTSELARLADKAFLRINGAMEGEISLQNSTRTTRAALGACYRY